MKAIAILGSPRNKMNTDILLSKAVEGLKSKNISVEKIQLSKLNINPCIACDYCAKTGKCFRNDDMTDLYTKFDTSDIIIVASPLYFNSVTGITKMMIDRCQAFWSSKYVFNQSSIDKSRQRKGLFICTGGAKQDKDGFIGATVVMDLFFKAINTQYAHNLLVDNTDKLFVEERKDVQEEAYSLGQELAKF